MIDSVATINFNIILNGRNDIEFNKNKNLFFNHYVIKLTKMIEKSLMKE